MRKSASCLCSPPFSLELSPPFLPELHINMKKSSSSRSCHWRRQAISGRVRERGLTGTNIVTVGGVSQRSRGASCCVASASVLAVRVAICPKCQKMLKIFSGSKGRKEERGRTFTSNQVTNIFLWLKTTQIFPVHMKQAENINSHIWKAESRKYFSLIELSELHYWIFCQQSKLFFFYCTNCNTAGVCVYVCKLGTTVSTH